MVACFASACVVANKGNISTVLQPYFVSNTVNLSFAQERFVLQHKNLLPEPEQATKITCHKQDYYTERCSKISK